MLGVRFEPVPDAVWLVPAEGLFVDSVPVEPMEGPLAATLLQGTPFAPIRPGAVVPDALPSVPGLVVLLGFVVLGLALPTALGFIVPWLIALGFDGFGVGLAGVVAELPREPLPVALAALPPLAAEPAPAPLPPALPAPPPPL